MAEPKKRTNKYKKNMRRMHDKVNSGAISFCEKCHEPKERHKICYTCGSYKNIDVLELDKKKKSKEKAKQEKK